ncbi:MAG: nucleotidyltransferase family protein [Sphingobacteriales bacterium]|nr:nucleotidyltransferase family protein [Sphingobacteriales bacterium]
MKAMVFAAGLGTRLKPLTDNCPKALIPVGGKPMLQIAIEQLKRYGFDEIIINVHYLGAHIHQFLKQHHSFGIRIDVSDETDGILETGGGLWKARRFFDDGKPFLLCNSDVLTNIHLDKFYQSHLQNNAIATLAVRNRKSSRYLLFDDEDVLCGWKNSQKNEQMIPSSSHEENRLHPFAFSGYHIISPEIFKHNSKSGKFSMIDWYLAICGSQIIKAYHHDEDIWVDIGSEKQLQNANELMRSANIFG